MKGDEIYVVCKINPSYSVSNSRAKYYAIPSIKKILECYQQLSKERTDVARHILQKQCGAIWAGRIKAFFFFPPLWGTLFYLRITPSRLTRNRETPFFLNFGDTGIRLLGLKKIFACFPRSFEKFTSEGWRRVQIFSFFLLPPSTLCRT